MSGFKFELKGMDEVLEQLDTSKLEKEIAATLEAFGKNVARDAKNRLSENGTNDNGFLTGSIGSETLGPMTVSIYANIDYAAYVEFGTGPYAARYVPSLEPGWQALARTFYVNGKGRMPAQPFFHPAFEKNRLLLLDDLRDLLQKK